MDLEFLEKVLEEDECRSPPRAQSSTPEDSRSGGRESPFLKWGSPSRANDSNEFHSGEERETDSPTDQGVYPLTIEQGDQQIDTPLHSVSWKDESHPLLETPGQGQGPKMCLASNRVRVRQTSSGESNSRHGRAHDSSHGLP